jgi:uncharacterized repeat protein (TIGR02543 family)
VRRLTILLAVLGALLLVPAAQALANGTMTVHIEGAGSGEVIGIEELEAPGEPPMECTYTSPGPATGVCKTELSTYFGVYEAIGVEAVAAPGSEFVEWTKVTPSLAAKEGCPSPGEEEVNARRCIGFEPEDEAPTWEATAVFSAATPKVSLTIAKTGEGTITSNPAGIECTGAKTGAECEAGFEQNSTVTLTASPAAGNAFSAWSGCLEHVGLTCKVLMDKAKTVKATFVATPSLTVEKAGSGYGKVAATGISCDESCSKESAAVKTGTAVTVKVTPAKGNEFATFEGGTGNASSCSATCTFTISENSSVKVKFSPIPTKTLTVKLTGPGAYKGKVTGKGVTVKGLLSTAIGCGSGCTTETETFFATGETELIAAASTGYAFKGWTVSGGSAGTCTGTTTPCKLATDANKTVEAKFE